MNTKNIDAIEDELRDLSIAISAAEAWSPSWRSNEAFFQAVLNLEVDLERAARDYLRGLGDRVNEYVDWEQYDKVAKLSADEDDDEDDDEYDVRVMFDDEHFEDVEEVQIKTMISEIYLNGIALGYSQEQEKKTGIPQKINMTVESPITKEIQATWDDHALQLTQWMNGTSSEAVVRSVQESLALGESQQLAAKRLRLVIDDVKRANTIAQTETVRAIALGESRFAIANGAITKDWDAMPGADASSTYKPCVENSSAGQIPIKSAFPSGQMLVPGHPKCRCRNSYQYP